MAINDAGIRTGLVEAADMLATKARQNVASKNIPQNIAGAIMVGQVVQDSSTRYHIDVIVDTRKAPAAAAYEFGSGEHATRGNVGKYPIVPKEKKFLAFHWPKVDGEPGFRRLPDGRVLLYKVEHPGVEARPYMKPALEEMKSRMAQAIGQRFVTEVIFQSIREAFRD